MTLSLTYFYGSFILLDQSWSDLKIVQTWGFLAYNTCMYFALIIIGPTSLELWSIGSR